MDEIVLARQPIFDKNLDVAYYELLYRATSKSEEANLSEEEGDVATTSVLLNLFTELGIEHVTGKQCAFINLTRNLLVSDIALSFPKDKVVIEILENMEVDEELLEHVTELTNQGYTLALDDFVYQESWRPLMSLAKYIKIDIQNATHEEVEMTIEASKEFGCELIAEKIENHEAFERCKELGFDYFQGYFLCKPNVVKGSKLPASKAVIMNIITELQNPESSVTKISEILSHDAALSFKLLRILNSAAYSLPRKIESLHEAVVLLGRDQIQKLANMIMMTNVSDKPNELMNIALTRAKQCEVIAETVAPDNKNTYFTVGLFSMLDAMMDQPLPTLLETIPISDELKEALLTRKGTLGKVLTSVENYEHGNWDDLYQERGLTLTEYQMAYMQAIEWTESTIKAFK